MVLEGRAASPACGLLDFQDAVRAARLRPGLAAGGRAPRRRPRWSRRCWRAIWPPSGASTARAFAPPTPCSAPSATPRSSASSPGSAGATASRVPAAHPADLAPPGGRPGASGAGAGQGLVRPEIPRPSARRRRGGRRHERDRHREPERPWCWPPAGRAHAAADRHTPKPLVEVRGRAMIDRVLDRCEAGVREAVVNLHSPGRSDRAHWRRAGGRRSSSRTRRDLWRPAAACQGPAPLGKQPFFVLNGDVVWLDGGRRRCERWPRPGTSRDGRPAAAAPDAPSPTATTGRATSS